MTKIKAAAVGRLKRAIKILLSSIDADHHPQAVKLLEELQDGMSMGSSWRSWKVSTIVEMLSSDESLDQDLIRNLVAEDTKVRRKAKSATPKKTKRSAQNEEYALKRKEFLRKNTRCCRCGGRSQQVHHIKGRLGDLLTDTSNFAAVCDACHKWIESHPSAAKRFGFSASKISGLPSKLASRNASLTKCKTKVNI